MSHYVLDGHEPVLVDLLTWASWFEKAERRVAEDELPDGVRVSTVFLGLDHGLGGSVELFETMVFGGEHDGYQARYVTWDQAESGHREAVAMCFVA